MKKRLIPYDPKLKELAKELRNNSTLGEVILWKKLRNRQLMGYDFHRQKPLLNYIVDFYSGSLSLVIELDGNSHNRSEVQLKDAQKEKAIKEYDITVLRFTETQVRFQIDDVMRVLEDYVLRFKERES